jgi:hypothetical protein
VTAGVTPPPTRSCGVAAALCLSLNNSRVGISGDFRNVIPTEAPSARGRSSHVYKRRKGNRATAEVMVARRLAVRLYWMLRQQWTYAELVRPAGEPESFRGKQ